LNGQNFASWPSQNESELKAYLDDFLGVALKPDEVRHFFAIRNKYLRNPYISKSKVNYSSIFIRSTLKYNNKWKLVFF